MHRPHTHTKPTTMRGQKREKLLPKHGESRGGQNVTPTGGFFNRVLVSSTSISSVSCCCPPQSWQQHAGRARYDKRRFFCRSLFSSTVPKSSGSRELGRCKDGASRVHSSFAPKHQIFCNFGTFFDGSAVYDAKCTGRSCIPGTVSLEPLS